LIFAPYPDYLRDHFTAALKTIGAEMEQLRRRDAISGECGLRMENLEKEGAEFLKTLETTPPTDGQKTTACYAQGQAQVDKMESFYNETYLQTIQAAKDTSANQ